MGKYCQEGLTEWEFAFCWDHACEGIEIVTKHNNIPFNE